MSGWRYPLAFVLGIAAFFGGWLLVQVGAGCTIEARGVRDGDAYQGWAILVGVFFAAGLFGFLMLAGTIRRLWSDMSGGSVSIVITVVVCALYLAVAIAPGALAGSLRETAGADYPSSLCSMTTRVRLVNGIGAVLLLPGLVLLDWVRQRATTLIGDADLDTALFLRLRQSVDSTMVVLGGVFTVALVATAALRNAVTDASGEFTQIRLVLFGVQYTALLLILYWPPQAALNRTARLARDDAVSPPSLRDGDLLEKVEARTAIDKLLGATTTPLEGIQARAAIAAPLVTSLIGSLLTAES